jgi:hypothetical protein
MYSKDLVDNVARLFRRHLPEPQAEALQMLTQEFLQNNSDVVQRVKKLLPSIELDTNNLRNDARANKAIELAQGYVQREPDAVALVNQILTRACVTIDTLMADALLAEGTRLHRAHESANQRR